MRSKWVMTVILFALAIVLLPVFAIAGTATVTPGEWVLYKGSAIVVENGLQVRVVSEAACIQKARDLNVTQNYTCRTSTAVKVTATTASSSSSSVSSSASSSSSVSSSSGSSVSSSSASSTASSSSSSVATWTHCANEGALCAFTGTRTIRFGIDTRWTTVSKTASGGGVTCNTTYFADPAPGATKTCQLQSTGSSSSSSTSSASSSSSTSSASSSSSSAATGSASLTWMAPIQNTDGTSISAITGYRLYYNTTGGAIQSVTLSKATSHTLSGLSAGTWYFRIATISSDGEGPQSNAASKTL